MDAPTTVSPRDSRKSITLFSLFFLVFFGAMGIVQPFITLYFRELGFSGTQISVLMGLTSILLLFLAPRYGLLFDNSSKKRTVLAVSLLLALVTMGVIPYVAGFAMVLVFWTIHRLLVNSVSPVTENLSFRVGSTPGKGAKNRFGSIRLWGSIGYAGVAVLGGWVYQTADFKSNTALFMALFAVAILLILVMPRSAIESTPTSARQKLDLLGVLRLLTRDRYLWLMVIALALTDPLLDGIRSFEPIFMQETGIPEVTIGLASSLSALSEVPFLLWVDALTYRFGIRRMVLFTFVFDFARLAAVWLFPFPAVIFTAAVLRSVSFTFRLNSTLNLVNRRVPQQISTTAITLISVTMFGTGHMLSNTVSGLIYDNIGARHIYLYTAMLCLVSLAIGLAAGKETPSPLLDAGAPGVSVESG